MTREWAQIPGVKELRRSLNPDWNPPFNEIVNYVKEISMDQGFTTEYTIYGNEVIIS